MKHQDRPTDTGRDYDYTDSAAVDDFARACAALGLASVFQPS